MRRLLTLMAALCLAVASSFAQGSIRGTVTNESGRPQPDVTVIFRNGAKAPVSSTTDKRGAYTSPKLVPGTYTVTFFAAGYESLRYTDVPMSATAQIIVNAALQKSGAWGRSTISWRYAPTPPMVKVSRKKNAYKLRGVYPSGTATIGISRSAPVVEEAATITHLAPPMPETRKAPARSAAMRGDAIVSGSGSSAHRSAYAEDAMPGSVVHGSSSAAAGSLSSGEINDFSKWTLWQDIGMEELKGYRSAWPFRPEARYTVMVKSADGSPLCNAYVKMTAGGRTVWETLTDNTGKAELWYGMWDTGVSTSRLSASVEYGSRQFSIPALMPFSEGANMLTAPVSCLNPAKLDIAFIVDATGSMQDEIDYLKAELRDILQKVKDSIPATQVQTGAIFYRDASDAYITRSSDLTADFSRTEAFIAANNADGGGDFPEALDAALEEGLNALHWRDDAAARLAFLVLDAPPHGDEATIKRMQRLTAQYASRGIRLIPVVCSGSDKSTEYLMRAIALATNGTYLFLTDHSGIGGRHTAPTTDKYDVEYLNGLIYRVIYQFSYMPNCKPGPMQQRDTMLVSGPTSDSAKTISWRYYPNPTTGILHVEHTHTAGFLLVSDVTGKAILRVPADPSGRTTIDLGQYPAGLYAIRYNVEGDKWVSGKFVIVH